MLHLVCHFKNWAPQRLLERESPDGSWRAGKMTGEETETEWPSRKLNKHGLFLDCEEARMIRADHLRCVNISKTEGKVCRSNYTYTINIWFILLYPSIMYLWQLLQKSYCGYKHQAGDWTLKGKKKKTFSNYTHYFIIFLSTFNIKLFWCWSMSLKSFISNRWIFSLRFQTNTFSCIKLAKNPAD